MGNCEHYMYKVFVLAEKLNIQKCVHLTENYVHNIRTECLDMHRN